MQQNLTVAPPPRIPPPPPPPPPPPEAGLVSNTTAPARSLPPLLSSLLLLPHCPSFQGPRCLGLVSASQSCWVQGLGINISRRGLAGILLGGSLLWYAALSSRVPLAAVDRQRGIAFVKTRGGNLVAATEVGVAGRGGGGGGGAGVGTAGVVPRLGVGRECMVQGEERGSVDANHWRWVVRVTVSVLCSCCAPMRCTLCSGAAFSVAPSPSPPPRPASCCAPAGRCWPAVHV